MPKSDLPIGGEYAPVADRIALFYEQFPAGRIITQLTMHNEREIVFRATVYRTEKSRAPAATGWASERIGDGDINTVACLENTETSAIGRALANLGFTASKNRPSAEEMAKAARVRRQVERARPTSPSHVPARPLRVAEPDRESSGMTLQRRADEAGHALSLLAAARRIGFSAVRAEVIARALTCPGGDDTLADRWTLRLREWMAIQRRKQWPFMHLPPDPSPGSQ